MLGKFSQAISDFEAVYFNTEPAQKYESFANWLEYQAPDYYAESDADVGYATPDAVTLTTVHQAKGMQWPAVFIPCLRKNRFPSKRHGGLGLFHVIPEAAIADADRYRGTVEDETRLFYVAVTRAEKYLFVSFSPGPNKLYKKRSDFFDHCASQQWFSTRDTGVPADAPRLEPQAHHETPEVTLSFSELKYLFECPYQFKLRFLYGFNPPLHDERERTGERDAVRVPPRRRRSTPRAPRRFARWLGRPGGGRTGVRPPPWRRPRWPGMTYLAVHNLSKHVT